MTPHRHNQTNRLALLAGVLSSLPFALHAHWLANRFPADTALRELPPPIWLTIVLLLALPVWASRRLKLLPAGHPPANSRS